MLTTGAETCERALGLEVKELSLWSNAGAGRLRRCHPVDLLCEVEGSLETVSVKDVGCLAWGAGKGH